MKFLIISAFLFSSPAHASLQDVLDRRKAIPVPLGGVELHSGEGSLAMGYVSVLVLGSGERLDWLGFEGKVTTEEEWKAFGPGEYSANRYQKITEFARAPDLSGAVDVPPGMRLEIEGRFGDEQVVFTVFTGSLAEQPGRLVRALKDLETSTLGGDGVIVVNPNYELSIYPTPDGEMPEDARQRFAADPNVYYAVELLIVRRSDDVLLHGQDVLRFQELRRITELRRDVHVVPVHIPRSPGRDSLMAFRHFGFR